jgi:hypothetical protein
VLLHPDNQSCRPLQLANTSLQHQTAIKIRNEQARLLPSRFELDQAQVGQTFFFIDNTATAGVGVAASISMAF